MILQVPVEHPISVIEVVVFIAALLILILFCGYNNRGGRIPFRVIRTRPTADKVEGIGGSIIMDYSYYSPSSGTGTPRALPVGFSTTSEREKPDTYELHKTRHDEAKRRETSTGKKVRRTE